MKANEEKTESEKQIRFKNIKHKVIQKNPTQQLVTNDMKTGVLVLCKEEEPIKVERCRAEAEILTRRQGQKGDKTHRSDKGEE